MLVIREAEKDDNSTIVELREYLREHHAYHAPEDYRLTHESKEENVLEEWYAKGQKVWVAEKGNRIVGYLRVKPKQLGSEESDPRKSQTLWYISQMVVEKAFQGQGIASRMMKYVEEKAREDKTVDGLSLTVAAFNTTASNVYRKQGFLPNQIEMKKIF